MKWMNELIWYEKLNNRHERFLRSMQRIWDNSKTDHTHCVMASDVYKKEIEDIVINNNKIPNEIGTKAETNESDFLVNQVEHISQR